MFEGGMGCRQMLQRVVNVNGRKMEFAMVNFRGPRRSVADFGVRGGDVGVVSLTGGARPASRRGVEGADDVVSVMNDVASAVF